jgi:hypothetical protein
MLISNPYDGITLLTFFNVNSEYAMPNNVIHWHCMKSFYSPVQYYAHKN